MLTALPVIMALSWVPTNHVSLQQPTPSPQAAPAAQADSGTITCPLTGNEIPSCCCPVKK